MKSEYSPVGRVLLYLGEALAKGEKRPPTSIWYMIVVWIHITFILVTAMRIIGYGRAVTIDREKRKRSNYNATRNNNRCK
jgi:hypothetical protein